MKNFENRGQSDSKIQYFCPMKCEGDKVYNEPGNCPVCNMHLVPVENKNKNSGDHHGHHGHEHHHGHHH